MKFSKLILFCSGLLLSCQLMAEKPIESGTHTRYVGYEFFSTYEGHPSIGYRYQKNSYMMDVNIGYLYIPTCEKPIHVYQAGVNGYRVFQRTPSGYFYAGAGLDWRTVMIYKSKCFVKQIYTEYRHSLLPSISVGRSFNMQENLSMFFELSYKPYDLEKREITSLHSLGMRMGIGF